MPNSVRSLDANIDFILIFLERTKGASLRYKLREFLWQLRYAWQRAWRGYDFTDVFELGYNFTAKMPVLLAEFLKNNVGLFYDAEADKQLDEEETNAVNQGNDFLL